ncbi:hypothetical protein AUK10_00800 [Candidatus Gracilibacteria bacterium CG2_30_37_12]|nr:MAG: hypothetical protein AUK10_00800 [Candidatus Gracilibacteria bacterium CG2_30_37_12]
MKHPFHLIDLVAFKKLSSLLAGNYKTSFHGSGIEFAGIREYSLGDNTTSIDWKASARMGKTYIKQYEEDRERKVLFVVDISESMNFGSNKKTKIETLAEAFSLLLFSSAENNDPSGAWFFSDTLRKMYKIQKGMEHLQKIHTDFDILLTQNERGISHLPMVVESLCQKRIKNHLVFIFSDSLELPKEQYLRSLSEQNDCIFIHIFDTFENTLVRENIHIITQNTDLFIDSSDEKKREQYTRERSQELENFRHTLMKRGLSYLSLDESKNVYEELYLFFKKRQNSGL